MDEHEEGIRGYRVACWVIIMILLTVVVVFLVPKHPNSNKQYGGDKYPPGTIVRIKLTGQKAMVLDYSKMFDLPYKCRVGPVKMNHPGFLKSNPTTTLNSYDIIRFKEFELMPNECLKGQKEAQ